MRFKALAISAITSLLAACASTPPVTVGYYLPRADLTLTVTRTVSCGTRSEGTPPQTFRTLHSITAVVPTPAYAADRDARHEIALDQLSGPLADSNLATEFYEDGRLKGINSSTTGRAGDIIQAAAALVPLVALASPSVGRAPPDELRAIEAACNAIDEAVGAGKAVSLIYEWAENFSPVARVLPDGTARPVVAPPRLIPLAARGSSISEALDHALPPICVDFGEPWAGPEPAQWHREGNASGPGQVALRRLVRYDARVFQFIPIADQPRNDGTCAAVPADRRVMLWSGSFQVPLTTAASNILFQNPGLFHLPIPRPAPFGNTQFGLSLAESGAITKLQYGNTSGVAAALGAVNVVASTLDETTAEQVAEYRNQADLIAQQQRLIRCQINPAECK